MTSRTAAAAAALVALAACARSPHAGGAGSHCDAPRHGDIVVGLDDLVRMPRWAEVSAARAADEVVPYTEGDPAVVTVATPLRGSWPATVTVALPKGSVDEARVEQSRHARLLAVGGTGRTLALVSLRADGQAHFLGDCGDEAYRPSLARLHGARRAAGDGRSEADLVRALATDPKGALATELHRQASPTPPPSPDWQHTSPNDRVLDSGAPPAVLAGLERATIVFRLPAGWYGVAVQLCPRIAGLAWQVCTVPSAGHGDIPLDVYVRHGAPVEVWLADRVRGFRGRHARVLTIPYSAFATGRVVLRGAAGVASADDAWRLARQPGALLRR